MGVRPAGDRVQVVADVATCRVRSRSMAAADAVYVRVRAIACQAALGRRDGGRGFPRCGAQETAASGRYRSRDLCLTSMNALVAAELDAEINV